MLVNSNLGLMSVNQ